jgi:hypothetical protein
MKIPFASLFLAAFTSLLALTPVNGATVKDEFLEMMSERVPVKYGHGDLVDLHIKIHYRPEMSQKDYPDFIQLKADLEKWTAEYDWTPIEGERAVYWETMVKDLSIEVIKNYPNINVAEFSVLVYPNAHYPYPHTLKSVATRPDTKAGEITAIESIMLPITSYGIEHQGPQVIDLKTEITYNKDLGIREYPPFEEIYAMLFKLMEDYPVESDYWETLVKSMSADILEAYPQISGVDMDLRVYPMKTLPYFHNIHCSTER